MRFGYAKSATAVGLQCHRRLLSISDQGAVKGGTVQPRGREFPARRARDGGRPRSGGVLSRGAGWGMCRRRRRGARARAEGALRDEPRAAQKAD